MRARWRAASEARPSHHAKVWALGLGSAAAGGAPAKSAALRESGGKVGQNTKPVGRVATSYPLGTPESAYPAFTSTRPSHAFPAPPPPPPPPWQSPLAAGSRARADREGRAPAHSRLRAACQTRREGSALYGPQAGRKRQAGPREETPYLARGGPGAGSAPAKEVASAAARQSHAAPPHPARAGPRPPPDPSSRRRYARLLAPLPRFQSYGNWGQKAGSRPSLTTDRAEKDCRLPALALWQNTLVSEPRIPLPPKEMGIK
ncbi:unnamed protein product [Rangifer tarandus platyrhynchus]|uniref:Uncharacterized protein n=1 Tax=Rangifer tarandus platyrhynchus TaxID=3082113 RepID=A0ABN8ZCI6_RANTA|nr:unnamed protein product [Rangifer tarandus platyrhynchus]CAI9688891.1 unnamed protein product [Rangifer tarandus platyrhynchus]